MWRLILLLALCVSVEAQEFGSFGDLPLLSSSSTAPTNNINILLPSGIAHDWDWATTSAGSVTDWVDKVQSFHWVGVLSGAVTSPTNSGDGVVSNLTNRLTATNWTPNLPLGGQDAILAVFKPSGKMTNNFSDETLLLGNGSASGELILGFNNTTVKYYDPSVGTLVHPPFDLVSDYLLGGSNGGHENNYTNGVLMTTTTYGGIPISLIGNGGFNGGTANWSQYKGSLYRVIHWTNVVGFTSVQVSNLHFWAKTVYGISP
jgi:hypothetical protein